MKIGQTQLRAENIAPSNASKLAIFNGSKKVGTVDISKMQPSNLGEKLYSFGLVSDIHFYKRDAEWVKWKPDTKFDNALTYFENEGCVFCAHCGDITQTGLYDEGDKVNLVPEQFANYKEICDKHTIPVYGICGNHESYVVDIVNNLTELKYYTGTDLYYTVAQENDLFIFIGQPSGGAVMSDKALQWLYETLEANRNKRCFVFVHAYIEEDSGDALDVRENSIFESWLSPRKNVFMNLLKHYKNTILFHGHSHIKYKYQESDINANYTERNGFRSVHVPSSATPRDIELNEETENLETVNDNDASEGCVVDVYDDCIVLNGTDLITGERIPIAQYRIDTTLQGIPEGTFTDSTGTITT